MDLRSQNAILLGLAPQTRDALYPFLCRVTLAPGTRLQRFGAAIERIVFPVSGAIELSVPVESQSIQCSVIGSNSMLGATVDLGALPPWDATVQVGGLAFQMDAADFRLLLARDPELRLTVAGVNGQLIRALTLMTACHAVHDIESRIGRWLLEYADCTDQPIPVTQGTLGRMLGVQRTTVTLIAGKLQELDAIRLQRGRISIVDRHKLETIACSCYARMTAAPASAAHRHGDGIDAVQLAESTPSF